MPWITWGGLSGGESRQREGGGTGGGGGLSGGGGGDAWFSGSRGRRRQQYARAHTHTRTRVRARTHTHTVVRGVEDEAAAARHVVLLAVRPPRRDNLCGVHKRVRIRRGPCRIVLSLSTLSHTFHGPVPHTGEASYPLPLGGS